MDPKATFPWDNNRTTTFSRKCAQTAIGGNTDCEAKLTCLHENCNAGRHTHTHVQEATRTRTTCSVQCRVNETRDRTVNFLSRERVLKLISPFCATLVAVQRFERKNRNTHRVAFHNSVHSSLTSQAERFSPGVVETCLWRIISFGLTDCPVKVFQLDLVPCLCEIKSPVTGVASVQLENEHFSRTDLEGVESDGCSFVQTRLRLQSWRTVVHHKGALLHTRGKTDVSAPRLLIQVRDHEVTLLVLLTKENGSELCTAVPPPFQLAQRSDQKRRKTKNNAGESCLTLNLKKERTWSLVMENLKKPDWKARVPRSFTSSRYSFNMDVSFGASLST